MLFEAATLGKQHTPLRVNFEKRAYKIGKFGTRYLEVSDYYGDIRRFLTGQQCFFGRQGSDSPLTSPKKINAQAERIEPILKCTKAFAMQIPMYGADMRPNIQPPLGWNLKQQVALATSIKWCIYVDPRLFLLTNINAMERNIVHISSASII